MKKNAQNLKITLSVTKEPILRYWAERASRNGRGYLSNTVRLALENYILNQSFYEIARLQFCDNTDVSGCPETIVFLYGMSPAIRKWVEELRTTGISIGEAVRFVLRNSIYVVSSGENEFMVNHGVVDAATTPSENFEHLLAQVTARISGRIRKEGSCSIETDRNTDFFISPGCRFPDGQENNNK